MSALNTNSILRFIATGFGSGLSPVAPGTFGTIACAALYWLWFTISPESVSIWSQSGVAVALALLGIVVLNLLFARGQYGAADSDPQEVVIDEFAGLAIALIGLQPTLPHLVLGVVCFRLFDITKVPPISTLERLPRGWGVMLDDLAAGVFAALLAHGLLGLGWLGTSLGPLS